VDIEILGGSRRRRRNREARMVVVVTAICMIAGAMASAFAVSLATRGSTPSFANFSLNSVPYPVR
jgi:hypothetical protein